MLLEYLLIIKHDFVDSELEHSFMDLGSMKFEIKVNVFLFLQFDTPNVIELALQLHLHPPLLLRNLAKGAAL